MTSTNTLITDAMTLIASPDDEGREAAIVSWVESERDKLTALYYASKAARSRAALFAEQAERMRTLATREHALADYCDGRARDLLETERRLAGRDDSEPYKVGLASGIRPGIVLNPPSVRIVDEAAIPMAYWRQPPTPAPVPDKVAIAAALKLGSPIEGVELVRGQRFDWGEPRTKRGD